MPKVKSMRPSSEFMKSVAFLTRTPGKLFELTRAMTPEEEAAAAATRSGANSGGEKVMICGTAVDRRLVSHLLG